MFITIQKNLGSSRHYHPRIFITIQKIWGVVDITIQEFSLPSKIIFWWFKSVENEQDFEFLAGMLLLRRVNGSSSFYKGPRTFRLCKSCSFSTLLNNQNMISGGSENSWMVMSTTPQFFLDGNEHYHPRIFTTLQNHNKSVK